MKTIYLTTLLLCTTTFIGCGSESSSSNPKSENTSPTERRLAQIHKYRIIAIATSEGNCKGAEGEMVINNNTVSGTIKTGWGDILSISGTYTKTNGDIDGGFAKNNKRLAQYSGTIKDNQGTGTWSDSLGCSGTWKGEGYETNYISSSQDTSNNHSNNNKKLNAYNIQGYELGFNYERGTSASISFGCDGSFTMKFSLSGVTRTSMRGDEITVLNSHQLKLVSSETSEKILISLDTEDNILEGASRVSELESYTINRIQKVSDCN